MWTRFCLSNLIEFEFRWSSICNDCTSSEIDERFSLLRDCRSTDVMFSFSDRLGVEGDILKFG